MKDTVDQLSEPTEAEIQKKAYHLWIEGGCLPGVELDNWLAAKELLRHHHGVVHDNQHSQRRPKTSPSAKAKTIPALAKVSPFSVA